MPTFKRLADGTWIDKDTGLPHEPQSKPGFTTMIRAGIARDHYKHFVGEIDDHTAAVSRGHEADAMNDIEKGVVELVQSGHLDRIAQEVS